MFRDIATPKKTYQDNRVIKMIAFIEDIARLLMNNPKTDKPKHKWDYLVRSVVEVYKSRYKKENPVKVEEEDWLNNFYIKIIKLLNINII